MRWLLAELVVVVLGILVAFQFEEWRTGRIDRAEELAILRGIHADLEESLSDMDVARANWERNQNAVHALAAHLQSTDERSAQTIVHSFLQARTTTTWSTGAPTYFGLTTSNRLGIIQSDKLRALLYGHYEINLPFMKRYQENRYLLVTAMDDAIHTDFVNTVEGFGMDGALAVEASNASGNTLNFAVFQPIEDFPRDPKFVSLLGRFASRTSGQLTNAVRVAEDMRVLQDEIDEYILQR